jgi:ribosomal protein S14
MSRRPYTASGPARCGRCGRERGVLKVVDGRYYCPGCLL